MTDKLHTYDGAYTPRHVLYDPKKPLSNHAYGVAVDFDAKRNGYGLAAGEMQMDAEVVRAFEEEGWSWGGRWRPSDAMHFEAVQPAARADWSLPPLHLAGQSEWLLVYVDRHGHQQSLPMSCFGDEDDLVLRVSAQRKRVYVRPE